MDYYDNSSCCFDDLINDIEDSSYQSDVLVNTGDFSDFFDALISSRNVLYSSEDMHLQHGFCQMESYQREFHFEQQNVLELGNSSDGFSSPSQSSDLLASAIDEIGDLSEFSCEDSFPSGSSCSSQTEVSPVPPVADADVTMSLDPVGVQSNEESALFQVLIERGKKIESPPFNVSSSFPSNFLLIELNLMFVFFSLQFSSGLNKLFANRNSKCPVQFKTAIPAQFEGDLRIRVFVSFTELVDQWEAVLCCKNDAHLGQLMQSDLKGAIYEKKGIHNSILLPLNGEGGFLCATTNFEFVCFSTCPSIQRRPMQLNFTVEHSRYVHSFSFSNELKF